MGFMYNNLHAVVGFNEYQLIFEIWIYITIHSWGFGKDITKEAEINNICLNEHSHGSLKNILLMLSLVVIYCSH